MKKFFVGVDLGQSQDYTGITVLERLKTGKQHAYHVRHLERSRGIPYPEIIEAVSKIMGSSMLKGHASLVIDQTGCGRPVFDMFAEAGLNPIGAIIHAGDSLSSEGRLWRVPKRDLVGCMQVLLQTGRLKVSAKLELGPILQQEMLGFKAKINPETASDAYSSWREADHDDLVLAVALAAWWGERSPEPLVFSVTPMTRPYSHQTLRILTMKQALQGPAAQIVEQQFDFALSAWRYCMKRFLKEPSDNGIALRIPDGTNPFKQ